MTVIVGAGLSGLACALELHRRGWPWLLLESSDRVGGRIGSRYADGFTFDLGFQVLLEAYPAVRSYLDLDALEPQPFEAGALIWDQCERFVFRRPTGVWDLPTALATARDRGLKWNDKVRLGLVAAGLLARSDREILADASAASTLRYLHGFSDEALERFFRPFFGGVLLDNELETSAALFRYYFKTFLLGRTVLPRRGMQAIPDQLRSRLPESAVRLGTEVRSLTTERGKVRAVQTASGESIDCDAVVLACPEPVSTKLAGGTARAAHSAAAVYFASERSLYPERLIVLPTGRRKLVRNFVQITNVCPDYAPPGLHLLSATVLKTPITEADVATAEAEIRSIYPVPTGTLRHVRTIEVPYACPVQPPGEGYTRTYAKPLPNVWRCGDGVIHASIQGAMESGAATARALVQ